MGLAAPSMAVQVRSFAGAAARHLRGNMTSSGRELLKWIALVFMTFDHVVKALLDGYVPVLSELGRIAFPVFALIMAFNLAQPGTDYAKSVKRLAGWGLIAQPFHVWAFGFLLPVNILFTFALATCLVWSIQDRRWLLASFLGLLAPLAVDYQWIGVWLVGAAWSWFRTGGTLQSLVGLASTKPTLAKLPWRLWICMGLLCWNNGNGWALLALPLMQLGRLQLPLPRLRWAFYGYYVAHLAVIGLIWTVS